MQTLNLVQIKSVSGGVTELEVFNEAARVGGIWGAFAGAAAGLLTGIIAAKIMSFLPAPKKGITAVDKNIEPVFKPESL